MNRWHRQRVMWAGLWVLAAGLGWSSVADAEPAAKSPPQPTTQATDKSVPATQPADRQATTKPATTQPTDWDKAVFRRIERPNHGRSRIAEKAGKQADEMIAKGLAFLSAAREKNGGWNEEFGPAVTAIVGKAFAQDPAFGPGHEITRRALDFVLRGQQQDGSIGTPRSGLANYETAVAVMFLSDMVKVDPRAQPAIDKAIAYFRQIQWDEQDGITQDDPMYGGIRYDPTDKRPDLSNTQMTLEALSQAGVPADDPLFQKALKYLERAQDLSETNDQPWARMPVPADHVPGGFIYITGAEKADQDVVESNKAGTVPGGQRPRSYGSMTYAGFKSMLYAGVRRDDRRVKAAFDWIREHYTLENNPNMPDRQSLQGLFYYYQVFGQALAAFDRDTIPTRRGERNWREDLIDQLAKTQRPDGSWANQADRWMEGDPRYVTAISILALQSALN